MAEEAIEGGVETAAQEAILDNLPPLEALTASDFEQILDAMALRRNNIEGEIEFMEEIEADEEDIRDLERDIEQLDRDLADVVARKEEFDALSKKQAAE